MLNNQPARTITKEQQTFKQRIKPNRRQRSECPVKEVKRLKQRSNGACERCDAQVATDKAHLERRWRSENIPTAEDFAHLCKICHEWADNTKEGRAWLTEFGKLLREREVS